MRTIKDHILPPWNDAIGITAVDAPGSGGAHHHYAVDVDGSEEYGVDIRFQNGPIGEVGANGVTNEALLAIVADRLRSFQEGPYRCKENACALTHIEEALHWLHARTLSRMCRGIEGTSGV
jgi:hypothetical protein